MLKAKGKWQLFGNPQQPSSNQDLLKPPPPVPVQLSPDAHKFGLENFGNTCYANSVLQALYFCPPFRDLLIQTNDVSVPLVVDTPVTPSATAPGPSPLARRKPERKVSSSGQDAVVSAIVHTSIPSSPPGLFSALRSLFVHISTHPSEKGTVGPKAFIDKLKELNELFRPTTHQDAHEFLNYLLNRIVEEIETPPEDELSNSVATIGTASATKSNPKSTSGGASSTFIHRLFEGVLTSETRCLTCETVSSRDESFLDLSIDIEQNSSVTACLRQFSASEMLCQKNKFFCDSCCDLQEAEKRMKIKKLPNVLALHLKRFKYQEDQQKFIKLAYRVAFPFELRLFNTVDDTDDADRLYNLYAIIIHIGAGPHHGHYISIIKTMGIWLIFDDETVSPIAEADIPKYFGDSPSGSAYVLYYQAADIDLVDLGLRASDQADSISSSAAPVSAVQDQAPSVPSDAAVPVPSSPAPPLVEEGDSSDLSDPPFPITPSQSSKLSAFSESADKLLKKPLVDPNVPFAPTAESPATTPTASNSPAKTKGIFDTLRRTSSTKFSGDGGPDKMNGEDAQIPPLPSIPPAFTSHAVNGKDKEEKPNKDTEKEKKSGGWFGKRKSGRFGHDKQDKRQEDSTLSPQKHDHQLPQPTNSGWFKTSPGKDKEKRRKPSAEPGFAVDLSAFSDLSSSRHSTSSLGGTTSEYGNGHADTQALPGPSPATQSPVGPTAQDFPARSSTLATPPPSSYHPPSSQTLFLPEHKKNGSSSSPIKSRHHDPPPPSSPPPRPTTAGADGKAPSPLLKELPPVPSPSKHIKRSHTHSRQFSGDHTSIDPVFSASGDSRRSFTMDDTGLGGLRPHRAPDSIGSSPMANQSMSSTTTSSTASSNLKRATRKLSLTAPFLGMGKKDKDKDKEKKDRDISHNFGLQTR